MSEPVTLKLTFSSKWFREPPRIKISVDDVFLGDVTVEANLTSKETNTFEYSLPLAEGEHVLSLEYYNKSDNTDTKIDADGNITDDHIFQIEDIEIDDISLGFVTVKNGTFFPADAEQRGLPIMIPKLTTIGYRGTYKLAFSVPTYIWFLETL